MSKILRIFIQIWAMVTTPIVFLGLLIPSTIMVAFLPIKLRIKLVGPFWKAFSLYTLHLSCWCKVFTEDQRQEELSRYPYQGLYIANHQSFIDIPLILSQYQVPPIMKKEVLYIPFIGLMGWAAGALALSRGKRDSRKKVFIQARERLVTQNYAVQYYPEGTRSKDGHPKSYDKLKVTLIHLAFDEKIPVVPISMYGTSKVISKSGIINPFQKIGIKTHPALFPKDYPDASSFARACWEKVVQGHLDLKMRLES
jgi:1-acyl-sn-glycerol-3-phosphate acyltransferase